MINEIKEEAKELFKANKSIIIVVFALIILLIIVLSLFTNSDKQNKPATQNTTYADVVSSTDNVFLVAEEHKMYTTMGTGGYTAYIAVKKDAAKKATSEQFYEFTHKRVDNSGYKWYCIWFEDSTGIIFYACNPVAAQYGVINRSNEMVEPHGNIILNDEGTFEYHEFPEYYVSNDENLEELKTASFFKSWYIKAIPCQMVYKEEAVFFNGINSYENKNGDKYYLYIVYSFDVSAVNKESLEELLDKDMCCYLQTVDENNKHIDNLKTFDTILQDDKTLYIIFYLTGDKPFAETFVFSQISIQQDRVDDFSYDYYYKFFVRNNTPSTDSIPEPLYSQIKDKIIQHENR